MHKGSPRTNQNAGSGSGRGVDRRGRDHPAQARNLPSPPRPSPSPSPRLVTSTSQTGGRAGPSTPLETRWGEDQGRGGGPVPTGEGDSDTHRAPPPPSLTSAPSPGGSLGEGLSRPPAGGGGGYTRHWGAPSLPSQWILGNYQLATPERLGCVLVENPRGGWGGTGGPLLSHPPPPRGFPSPGCNHTLEKLRQEPSPPKITPGGGGAIPNTPGGKTGTR